MHRTKGDYIFVSILAKWYGATCDSRNDRPMTATQTNTLWTRTTAAAPKRTESLRRSQAPSPAARPARDVLMTVKDVADECQLSETAVRRAIYEGELQAIKLRSRLRITRPDYDAWIASQRQAPHHRTQAPARPAARQPRRPPAGSFRALARADDQAPAL